MPSLTTVLSKAPLSICFSILFMSSTSHAGAGLCKHGLSNEKGQRAVAEQTRYSVKAVTQLPWAMGSSEYASEGARKQIANQIASEIISMREASGQEVVVIDSFFPSAASNGKQVVASVRIHFPLTDQIQPDGLVLLNQNTGKVESIEVFKSARLFEMALAKHKKEVVLSKSIQNQLIERTKDKVLSAVMPVQKPGVELDTQVRLFFYPQASGKILVTAEAVSNLIHVGVSRVELAWQYFSYSVSPTGNISE